MNQLKTIIAALLLLLISACNDAEEHYELTNEMPEVKLNFETVLKEGDSLTLIGRLNPENNLTIAIGEEENAPYRAYGKAVKKFHSTELRDYYTSYDTVKVAITSTMGEGLQLLSITSGGNRVRVGYVEIVPSPAMKGSYGMQEIARMGGSADVIFSCINGRGDIYFYKRTGNTIEHIAKDNTTSTLASLGSLQDEAGAYTIMLMYAGGVDSKGENLWFAARTRDSSPENATSEIYRLVHYDIKSGVFTTINRSVYPNTAGNRTLEGTLMPFEGSLSEAKIFRVSGVYPDRNDNLFIVLDNYAIARVEKASEPAAATVKYLISSYSVPAWMTATGFTSRQLVYEIPGSKMRGIFDSADNRVIDADGGIMYNYSYSEGYTDSRQTLYVFDLNARVPLESYRKSERDFRAAKQSPKLAGPFHILSGVPMRAFLPMPDRKLMMMFNSQNFTELDFGDSYARTYMENVQDAASLTQGLNYDEEGTLYMRRGNSVMKTVKLE